MVVGGESLRGSVRGWFAGRLMLVVPELAKLHEEIEGFIARLGILFDDCAPAVTSVWELMSEIFGDELGEVGWDGFI